MLTAENRQVFPKLAFFADGFSESEAAAIAGTGGDELFDIRKHLHVLSRANLLTFDKVSKLYRIHELVRMFALERLELQDEAYLSIARHYSELIEDFDERCLRESDGLLLSLLSFDDYKKHIKQVWTWLLRQRPGRQGVGEITLRYFKFDEIFGRMRFFLNPS